MTRLSKSLLSYLFFVLALSGCDEVQGVWKEVMQEQTLKESSSLSVSYDRFLAFYLHSAQIYTGELQNSVSSLKKPVAQLLEHPDDEHLQLARSQWALAYYQFQTGTLYHHFAKSFPGISTTLYQIDTAVTMPGYIDSIKHYPLSGIINDVTIPLSLDTLKAQHGLTDIHEVCLGFGAIAFILWGEDGNRSANDFIEVVDWGGEITDLPVQEHNNNRRRLFLTLIVQQLNADVNLFAGSWQPSGGVYRQLRKASDKQIIDIVISLIDATKTPRTRQVTASAYQSFQTLKTSAMLQGLNTLIKGEPGNDQQLNFYQLANSINSTKASTLHEDLKLLNQSVHYEYSNQLFKETQALSAQAITAFAQIEQSLYRIATELGIQL